MDLYLMRHGIAVPRESPEMTPDEDRPLSPRGIKRTRKAARGLSNLEIGFERIFTSPFRRARQTAEIIAEILELGERPVEMPELAPGGSGEELLSSLSAHRDKKRLLLVGHQPFLGEMASYLLTADKGILMDLRKGGLCHLKIDDFPEGKAALQCLLTSKQLRLMA